MKFFDRLFGIEFNKQQLEFNKEQIRLVKLFDKRIEALERHSGDGGKT